MKSVEITANLCQVGEEMLLGTMKNSISSRKLPYSPITEK